MQCDPRYRAPEIDGYVIWSNLTRDEAGRMVPMSDIGREWCLHRTVERLGVPIEAVRIEAFTPNDGYDCPQWTAYVRNDFASVVSEFHRDLADKLRTLTMMRDLEQGRI